MKTHPKYHIVIDNEGNFYTEYSDGLYKERIYKLHWFEYPRITIRCRPRGQGWPKIETCHRIVWECHNGLISKGYVIHHKDKNKHNFNIENLECITHKQHGERHSVKVC